MSANTGLRHPFTKALYEKDGNNLKVTATDGRVGIFARDGSWIEGDLRECDPQMCNWIGGPVRMSHRMQADHE